MLAVVLLCSTIQHGSCKNMADHATSWPWKCLNNCLKAHFAWKCLKTPDFIACRYQILILPNAQNCAPSRHLQECPGALGRKLQQRVLFEWFWAPDSECPKECSGPGAQNQSTSTLLVHLHTFFSWPSVSSFLFYLNLLPFFLTSFFIVTASSCLLSCLLLLWGTFQPGPWPVLWMSATATQKQNKPNPLLSDMLSDWRFARLVTRYGTTTTLSQRLSYCARWGFECISMKRLGATPLPWYANLRCDIPCARGYLIDTYVIPHEIRKTGYPLCNTILRRYCSIWGGYHKGKSQKVQTVIQLDHSFYEVLGESENIKVLTFVETVTSMSRAVIFPDHSANQVAIKTLNQFIAVNGFTKLIFQCDGRLGLLNLQEQIAEDLSLPTQVSLRYSHQNQDTVESFHKTFYATMVRSEPSGLDLQIIWEFTQIK